MYAFSKNVHTLGWHNAGIILKLLGLEQYVMVICRKKSNENSVIPFFVTERRSKYSLSRLQSESSTPTFPWCSFGNPIHPLPFLLLLILSIWQGNINMAEPDPKSYADWSFIKNVPGSSTQARQGEVPVSLISFDFLWVFRFVLAVSRMRMGVSDPYGSCPNGVINFKSLYMCGSVFRSVGHCPCCETTYMYTPPHVHTGIYNVVACFWRILPLNIIYV